MKHEESLADSDFQPDDSDKDLDFGMDDYNIYNPRTDHNYQLFSYYPTDCTIKVIKKIIIFLFVPVMCYNSFNFKKQTDLIRIYL